MTVATQGFEARLEEFRQLTRDEGLSLIDAARKMGISKRSSSVYENTLTERTGETRNQHLFRRYQELLAAGHSKREASRKAGVSIGTCIRWEQRGGPHKKKPNFNPDSLARGRITIDQRREARLERFRILTRDQGKTIKTACLELGITTKTGNDYEHELTRRTGLTLRQHRQKTYQELREFLPQLHAAEFLKIHRSTAGEWDQELGLSRRRSRCIEPV